MIGTVLNWIGKFLEHIYMKKQALPNVRVLIRGQAASRGTSTSIRGWEYHWHTSKLVFFNDSRHIARGIKIYPPRPKGWTIRGEYPTRLEADEQASLELEIRLTFTSEDFLQWFEPKCIPPESRELLQRIMEGVTFKLEYLNEFDKHFSEERLIELL